MGVFDKFKKVPEYTGEFGLNKNLLQTIELIKGNHGGITGLRGRLTENVINGNYAKLVFADKLHDCSFTYEIFEQNGTYVKLTINCHANAKYWFDCASERLTKK